MRILKLIRKISKVAVALIYLSWGILVLITTKNLKPVYRGLRFFLEHESYQITLRKLLADPKTQALIQQRYRQGKQVEWDRLRAMPVGTLGHEFAKFMNNPEVTPLEKLPEANTEISPEIDYIRQRIRLIHDIHHVVCGLPADELGEMGISAFYVAQVNSPLNSMLLGVGFFKCTLQSPARLPELMNAISEGWKQGLECENLFGIKFEEMWELPIGEVRARLKVKASERDFIYAA